MSTHSWANESQDTTAPIKRRMAPVANPERISREFAAQMVEIATARIQAVWDDVGETDATTLAQNVVAAQEWLWMSMQLPVGKVTS